MAVKTTKWRRLRKSVRTRKHSEMVAGMRSRNENGKTKRKGQRERTRRIDELMHRRNEKKGKYRD